MVADIDIRALADRLLIRELIDEYSNCCTQKDCDRLAEMFIEDCLWRTTGKNCREFRGREAVVGAIRAVVEGYPLIVQMPHAPRIELDGDQATSTTLMHEFGLLGEAATAFTFAVYRDRLVRTEQGWRFAERTFDGLYQEAGTSPAA